MISILKRKGTRYFGARALERPNDFVLAGLVWMQVSIGRLLSSSRTWVKVDFVVWMGGGRGRRLSLGAGGTRERG